LDSYLPIVNNFAFNYYQPPTIDRKLCEKLRNHDLQITKEKSRSQRFPMSCLFFCCKTRQIDD